LAPAASDDAIEGASDLRATFFLVPGVNALLTEFKAHPAAVALFSIHGWKPGYFFSGDLISGHKILLMSTPCSSYIETSTLLGGDRGGDPSSAAQEGASLPDSTTGRSTSSPPRGLPAGGGVGLRLSDALSGPGGQGRMGEREGVSIRVWFPEGPAARPQ